MITLRNVAKFSMTGALRGLSATAELVNTKFNMAGQYNTIQYNIRNLYTPSLTVKNRHESAMDVP